MSAAIRCDATVSTDVAFFLSDGFSDYLAARVLLLSGLPKQGAIMASTAVEKSLKAVLAVGKTTIKTHVSQKHWEALTAIQPQLASELDQDFVLLCEQVYLLRYTGDPPAGFNVVVATREFLAELDETICRIHLRFQWMQAGVQKQDAFGLARSQSDARLWNQNHFLANADKATHLQGPQLVYEVRQRVRRGALIEIQYTSSSPATHAGFLRPGVVPGANGKTFELSHKPDGP